METSRNTITINPESPGDAAIDQGTDVLEKGGLLVAPTETSYGLLGRADNQQVLERLYALKRRPVSRATALLVGTLGEIEQLAHIDPLASILIDRFLPGPLTLVLKARHNWPPPRVVDGKIGIRWSSAKIIGALLSRIDFPVTATSANISGHPEPRSVESIKEALGDAVSLYMECGELSGPVSTVVDCTGATAKLLREGAIARSDLLNCVGDKLD